MKLRDSKLLAVKGGLAFAPEHSFLSNFHPCEFQINGQQFHCSEQAYPFICAKNLGAPEVADKIMRANNAKECKKLSYLCTSIPEWDQVKCEQMKVIVQEKFYQNDTLQNKLLDTGVDTLIEATTDTFWGAGVVFGSKLLSIGIWSGMNTLGQLLAETREDIKRTKGWEHSRDKSCDESALMYANPNSPNQHNARNDTADGQASNRKGISFVPENFNPNQSTRAKSARRQGKGRCARNHNPSSLYAMHAQGIHGYPTAPQMQMHSQIALSQGTAGFNPSLPPTGNSIYPTQPVQQMNLSQHADMYNNTNTMQVAHQQP